MIVRHPTGPPSCLARRALLDFADRRSPDPRRRGVRRSRLRRPAPPSAAHPCAIFFLESVEGVSSAGLANRMYASAARRGSTRHSLRSKESDARLCATSDEYAVPKRCSSPASHQPAFRDARSFGEVNAQRLPPALGLLRAPAACFYASRSSTFAGRNDADSVLGLLRATGVLCVSLGFGMPAEAVFFPRFLASPE